MVTNNKRRTNEQPGEPRASPLLDSEQSWLLQKYVFFVTTTMSLKNQYILTFKDVLKYTESEIQYTILLRAPVE